MFEKLYNGIILLPSKAKVWSESHSVMSDSLRPHGLHSPWNSPGQNTGVGSLSLLQGIFPTQGLNPGLPHCRQILYQLSYKGSPRILEWVAYPFSSGSSQPRNWIGKSPIRGERCGRPLNTQTRTHQKGLFGYYLLCFDRHLACIFLLDTTNWEIWGKFANIKCNSVSLSRET